MSNRIAPETTEKPQSEKRSHFNLILRNFSFIAAGKLVGEGFTFLLFVMLSRTFAQEGIGLYSFAIGLTGFFTVLVDFGLDPMAIKEISRRKESFRNYYGKIFSLRLLLTLTALGLILLSIPFLPFSSEALIIIAVIGIYQIGLRLAESFALVFLAFEDSRMSGILTASIKITGATAAILVALLTGSLVLTLVMLTVVSLVGAIAGYALVTRKYGRPNLTMSPSLLTKLGRQAIPYALSDFLVQFYSRVDVVMLGFILGASSAGVFNVAYRVVFILTFIPTYASLAILPQASRLYEESRDKFASLYHETFKLVVLAGFPIAAGVFLIAPELITTVFGQEFNDAIFILRILSVLLLLSFFTRIMGVFLMASDRQVGWTRSQWIAATVNLSGNAILIPTQGIVGAAIATVISETLLVILFINQLRPVIGLPHIGSRLLISAVGVATFYIPFVLIPGVSFAVAIPVAMLLYSATLIAFGQTRNHEIRMLISFLKPSGMRGA